MDPVDGNRRRESEDSGGVAAGGSGPSDVKGRPGWSGLLAAGAVVLIVGGFALSRDYGVQSIPSPPDFEEIATPTTSGTTFSTVTTVAGSGLVTSQSGHIRSFDWLYEVRDIEVAPDGAVYVIGGVGVASLDSQGEWTLLDIDGLPEGTGTDDGFPGRIVEQITIGPDGTVWLAGMATSRADDEEFGGTIDGWFAGRVLWWVARNDGCDEVPCSWSVLTSNEVPELEGGVGDAAAGRQSFHALVDDRLLLVYDGKRWESHRLPTGWLWSGNPWATFSMTVDRDGIWWAANSGRTLITFDGTDFTEHTVEDGLLDDIYQVTAGVDGTIWVATDPNSAEAAGIAAFDGTSWTVYTTSDGLLSNHAVIATGTDGTVWAVHSDDPPFGYSRFDGTEWTAYQFDLPVGDRQAAVTTDGTLWTKDNEIVIGFDGTTRVIHPSPFPQPVPGTITISIDGWEGVEGYRLLAAVWSESEVVGGAFWTIIDSDPYTGTDVAHPPNWGEDPPGVDYESWGEGDYLWDETAWLYPGTYQIRFWANPGELDPYGNLIPAGLIERECSVVVEVAAGHNTTVVISDIPMAGEGGECQRATDDTSVRSLTFTPVQWGIILDDDRPGVHTVLMDVDAGPLNTDAVEDVSGKLIWDETVVDLCNIGIDFAFEHLGADFIRFGDTFQTTEGCGSNPSAMQDAFNEYGLPDTACLTVWFGGRDYEYCAPLPVVGEPGTVTVVFDGLEGFEGLDVVVLVAQSLEDESDELEVIGGINLRVIDEDPFSTSEAIRLGWWDPTDEKAVFEPGTYLFIIEAYDPNECCAVQYGCKQQIQVIEDETLIVTITGLPTDNWWGRQETTYPWLKYPDCPS